MRTLISTILGLAFFITSSLNAAPEVNKDHPKSVTIGFIPSADPVELKKKALEFAKLFQNEIQVPVNIFISEDYNSLVEAMKKKQVDFAFFSAVTYVKAEATANAKVLLKKVFSGPFYYSVLITKKSAQTHSIEQLKGKRIAFVDKNSASGYLYPLVMLKAKKIDPKEFFSATQFSGNHEKSVHSLEKGEVDAIATFADDEDGSKTAVTKYLGEKSLADYEVVWKSEPIPNDPFCVRADFYDKFPKFSHTVMFTLIELSERLKKQESLLKYLNINELSLATNRQYDPVREMVKALDLK